MESSSEESFAWTDASSDSYESVEMKEKDNIDIEKGISFNNTQEKEVCYADRKERKRKIKTEDLSEESIIVPTPKRIKLEPESDLDTKNKLNKKKKPNQTDIDESYLDLRVKEENAFSPILPLKTKKKKKKRHSNNDNVDENSSSYDISVIPHENENNTLQVVDNDEGIQPKIDECNPKLSDRIRFEDEDNVGMDISDKKSEYKIYSKNVRKYLKANLNLKNVQNERLSNGCKLSPKDEIWLLNCPSEVDINSFKNANVKIDEKCKVKISGQTFEGTINNDKSSLVLSTEHNNSCQLTKKCINGIVCLHKRIPRIQNLDQDFNINTNVDKFEFTPLPQTKYRHPLFGSHYKKAIKLSKSVIERLNKKQQDSVVKLKKHKNKSNCTSDEMFHYATEQESDTKHNILVKKKKKQKQSQNETLTKKLKLSKNYPSSAEVWESEKAIEENLFNF